MIDQTFVQAIEAKTHAPKEVMVGDIKALAVPQFGGDGEVNYGVVVPADLEREKKAVPAAPVLEFTTLSGVGEYLKTNRDGWDLASVFLHITSPTQVVLRRGVRGEAQQRDVIATIKADALVSVVGWLGRYVKLEEAIISLQAQFAPSEDRDHLILLLSKVTGAVRVDVDDTGVSQSVAVKTGIALVSEQRVPSRVLLAPYRTFREVAQPASEFILRLSGGTDKELPTVALFEADGQTWKLDAMQRVKDWLDTDLSIDDTTAVIPVLA